MEQLGPFDPRPFLRTYTIMMLCFPLKEFYERGGVLSILASGCSSLTRSIPYLKGQVKHDPDQPGEHYKSGLFHVVPFKHPDDSILRVKDLPDDFPSYDQIRKAKAPSAMLDGAILSPERGFPDQLTDSDTCPVLVVQANFCRGGLLLTFAGMHIVMDGNGLGQLIRMFASGCRGEPILEEDIRAAHLNRETYIPSLKESETPMKHLDLRIDPNENTSEGPKEITPMLWTYFRLPASNLSQLKLEASKDCPPGSWITTNDAISALIWKAITKARSPHLNTSETCTLLRAINMRRVLKPPVPDNFLGNTVWCSFIHLPIKDLIDRISLSAISRLVRKETLEIDDFYIRSLAQLLRDEPDKRTIGFDTKRPERDFVVSSWADLPVYPEEGFGSQLGMPEFVRRPNMTPMEGLAYLMPKDPEGNIDLAIALRESDLEGLKNEEEWMSYAEYIG